MVAVFMLLTLMAMQIISIGLLSRLRAFYVENDKLLLQNQLQDVLLAATGGSGTSASADLSSVQSALAASVLPPEVSGLFLLGPHGTCKWSTSNLDCAAYSAVTNGVSGNSLTRTACTPPGQQVTEIWCWVPIPGQAGGSAGAQTQTPVGTLVAGHSEVQIYQTIRQIHGILLTWTVVALVVMGLLSLILARTITGPIEALTRRARAMAAGDFAGRLPVQSRDEVGQLSLMFNHLGGRLQETLGQIRSEQRRLAAILDNMTDGILALDPNGLILLCNPAAGRMLTIEPATVVGQRVDSVMGDGFGERLRAAQGVAPLDGAADRAGTLASATVTGRLRSLHVVAQVAPLGGATRGSVVVLQDVTARERLESMRKEFVANVSHELRTPVTTVKLYAETLLEWGLDDPAVARPKVEVIAAETERMHRLIRDLLLLSQLDTRAAQARPHVPVHVPDLVAQVVDNLRASARQHGLDLVVDAKPACPEIDGDADGIVQVISNLVMNAIDFTPTGGRVTVGICPEGRGGVRVEVLDTGVGIPATDVPRIFDRFYRVETSRSREHGGSGLGLAIAREIVEAHRGRIWCESTVGRGSRFCFVLPAGAAS